MPREGRQGGVGIVGSLYKSDLWLDLFGKLTYGFYVLRGFSTTPLPQQKLLSELPRVLCGGLLDY